MYACLSFVMMISTFGVFLAEIKSHFQLRSFDISTPDGRAKERLRRILFASMASFFAKGIALSALLISMPLTLNYLGPERFGIWMTISSLTAVLGFADFGIGNGLLNVIAEAHGCEDQYLAKRAVTSSVVLLTSIGLILLVAFVIVYPMLDWSYILNISGQQVTTEAGWAVAVLAGCLAISLPLLTAQKVQFGYQEGLQANLWQSAGSIFMLIGILLAIRAEAGLAWLVFAIAGVPAVGLALNWLHQFTIDRRWLFPNVRYFDWKMGRRIASLGILWTWFQLMAFVGTAADNLIISYFFGAAAVSGYAVMSKLLSCLLIAQMFSASLWPAFSEAFERGDMEWIRKTFRRTLIFFSVLGVVGALVMGLGSFWIIRIWIGADMVPSTSMAIGFAFWSFITNFFSAIAALMANNRFLKQLTWLTTVGALSAMLLKLAFSSYFGIAWIIWATVIGYGLVCIPGILIARSALRSSG